MIPLRDANPTRRTPIVTLALIAACAAVFAVELAVQTSGGEEALGPVLPDLGGDPEPDLRRPGRARETWVPR